VTSRVPLGEGELDVDFPECEVTVVEPAGGTSVDPGAAAERAIADPHGPRLSEIACDAENVAIVVTDVTRATPDDELLKPMFEELTDEGVSRSDVAIVVGLGLHRPMDDSEIQSALGPYADLAINHDPAATVEAGTSDDDQAHAHVGAAGVRACGLARSER
jgi:nickel-dependent lactate racemase